MNQPLSTREEIISNVLKTIKSKLDTSQFSLINDFIRYYYACAPLNLLRERFTENLSSALMSHWKLIFNRPLGQIGLNVYNSNRSAKGSDLPVTVIEIATEDSPFLVDSITNALSKEGLNIYFNLHRGDIHFIRNDKNKITDIKSSMSSPMHQPTEALIYMEIEQVNGAEHLETLKRLLKSTLEEVKEVVEAFPKMREKLKQTITEIKENESHNQNVKRDEATDFLNWLLEDNFIFLGYQEYRLDENKQTLIPIPGFELGMNENEPDHKNLDNYSEADLTFDAKTLLLADELVVISKADKKARVHRAVPSVYIRIKQFNSSGEISGERRFIGLYTTRVYHTDPRTMPIIRGKIQAVLDNSLLSVKGHAWKALTDILLGLPRDDLFQSSVEQLSDLTLGMLNMQHKREIRLFVLQDACHRYVSCFVYIPQEELNTELQRRFETILVQAFLGTEVGCSTVFGESLLARLHFLIRTVPNQTSSYNIDAIEHQLVEAARSWKEDLKNNVLDQFGLEKGTALIYKYALAFPNSYRDMFSVDMAIDDIKHMEKISSLNPLQINFYYFPDPAGSKLRFKLFQAEKPFFLSDILPVLENLGLRVIDEWPNEIILRHGEHIWINDFGVVPFQNEEIKVEVVKENLQETFRRVWQGEVENDKFNRLVLTGQLTWRQIAVLRAYTKYLRQIAIPFSQVYIEDAVTRNAEIAIRLIKLFELLFDPYSQATKPKTLPTLVKDIVTALDAVPSLDDDRILRSLLEVIRATLRTNYFQKTKDGHFKSYFSFKIQPSRIADIPLPRPLYEVFVYSPTVEAVHLRAAKVARGGIRWSDRREDFRTEVLGLMKAQHVKNSLIVPGGAKGGFVCKNLPENGDREAVLKIGLECYRTFMRGLLDITDNVQQGKVVSPSDIVRYDDPDPYLVVAADKGTATFSDTANAISAEYNFWLGDAFATGGSAGYDHKKIGITSRGAWESAKRHFTKLNIDPERDNFTVIGIGDMSGDVFGNGMLLSTHIQLTAAFNHQHIFLDPTPDSEKSFVERQRLFNLPRSTWEDYNAALISQGGGIFKRSIKSIPLSAEIKNLLKVSEDALSPDRLIRAILAAPVNMLWNGGIGTYVKGALERNVDVGDRANDGVRINGNELRCQVVIEGGNLGFTQLGRVEYALQGGLIFTDFIDNSGGVDCSDHEVNCKILLNTVMVSGKLTLEDRNKLLIQMTEEIASLVIFDNFRQTRALSLAAYTSLQEIEVCRRYIEELERNNQIDRALEFLPSDTTILERKAGGRGLTSPELAILLSYTKILAKAELLACNSSIFEDNYFSSALQEAFPKEITARYPQALAEHGLRREIIATKVINALVDEMGITFLYRLRTEAGATIEEIVRAHAVARHVYGSAAFSQLLEQIAQTLPTDLRYTLMTQMIRLIRRACRWFIYNYKNELSHTHELIERFAAPISTMQENLPNLIVGAELEQFQHTMDSLREIGISDREAIRFASLEHQYALLDIVDASLKNNLSLKAMASTYFKVGDHYELTWMRAQILKLPLETHWDVLSRVVLFNDLDAQQRKLAVVILECVATNESLTETCLAKWGETHKDFLKRWTQLLSDLRSTHELKFMMFAVAVRELTAMLNFYQKTP